MRKSLTTILTTALMVGTMSTTFASVNPFSDVSHDHWAYDAVVQLAEEGVIEGYEDGTFKGDKNITRYEMAQMVAKAMSKQDSLNASQQALVNHLAAEFSDELNTLGVRVSDLEKRMDNVKWNGELRYTHEFTKQDFNSVTSEKDARTKSNEFVLRLEPSAQVSSKWKVNARLDAIGDPSVDKVDDVKLKRAYAEGNYDYMNVRLGKMRGNIDQDLIIDDEYSGGEVTFGKDISLTLGAGRWNGTDKNGVNFSSDTASYHFAGLEGNSGKLTLGTGYHHFGSDYFHRIVRDDGTTTNKADIWSVHAKYKFDKNFMMKGSYAENSKADTLEKAGSVELQYKGAESSVENTWGIYTAYRYLGGNVAFNPSYDGVGFNQKGWELGASYVPFKNVMTTIKLFSGNDLDNPKSENNKASKIFGRAELFF